MTTLTGGPAVPSSTLNALFFEATERHDLPNAYQVKRGGAWQPIPHSEVVRRARHISIGLESIGLTRGDRVGLLSENRLEWALVDWGCLCGGFTDVPLYPTLPPEQLAHPLNDAGALVLFVSTPEQAEKVKEIRRTLATVRTIISFADPAPPGVDYTLRELEAAGALLDSAERTAEWKATALAILPEEVATLIYTSGTTGEPKGVMLSHGNLASNCAAVGKRLDLHVGDVALSFLPLSHVFERTGDYCLFAAGVSIAYAEDLDAIGENMLEVGPSLAMCVPRLFERMYARIVERALRGSRTRARIFRWARATAERWADVTLAGGVPDRSLALRYALAQRLVFSRIRANLGGRLRFFVSGGAPLAPAIAKFFYAAGLPILEGYGLTETSPVITLNTLEAFRLGTVGRVIPGVEVRLAEDGEILTRGPHVMEGYHNQPAATVAVMDADGWFHTGDIGVVEHGFLRITDRKKDFIVTSGGRSIAPQPIENRIKLSPFVAQAVVVGEGRTYPVVLVVPNWDRLEGWATTQNLVWESRAQLLVTPMIVQRMEEEVRGTLTGLAPTETPRRIGLLEEDFSVERGEMTPKMSLRRRVIDETCQAVIDALYEEAAPV